MQLFDLLLVTLGAVTAFTIAAALQFRHGNRRLAGGFLCVAGFCLALGFFSAYRLGLSNDPQDWFSRTRPCSATGRC
ncbi:hypothetical protein [Ferrovibrio terrae]|uniref:hypothetical protein n=1 Tax=Ferrovibrio terrae TaxID=2594003 RepID=UPI003137D5ED